MFGRNVRSVKQVFSLQHLLFSLFRNNKSSVLILRGGGGGLFEGGAKSSGERLFNFFQIEV